MVFDFKRRRLLFKTQKGVKNVLSANVSEFMTDYVITIRPEKTVIDAAAVMIGEDVSALVVADDDKPIGILTERDFITKVPLSKKVFDLTVKDIMSCGFNSKLKECRLETVKRDNTLNEAQLLLGEKHIRKLIVLNDDGRVGGIITQSDLSKAIYELFTTVAKIPGIPFTVKDVMNPTFISIDLNKGFKAAKTLMTKKNISSLPVKKGKEYVGMITEYDVVTQFYDAGGKLDTKELADVIKSPIKAISASENIFDTNTIMLFQKVRRLIVVEDGKVVGFINQTDMVKACFHYLRELQECLAKGERIEIQDLLALPRKDKIISQYSTKYLRSFTMKD